MPPVHVSPRQPPDITCPLIAVAQPASDVSNLTLPSPAAVGELTALERVNTGSARPIFRFAPGVLVKFAWDYDAEVRALQFIHGRLSVRTPRVLHHAPFLNAVVEPWDWVNSVWYFFMEECPGVRLDTVIDHMSSAGLDHIADQLLVVLNEMRSFPTEALGPVTGGPYSNRFMAFPWQPPHAFLSTAEYLDYYRSIFLEMCGPEYVEGLFSHFPMDAQAHLTHGDLLPHNILVDGSKITAIIDWETAGHYPEFWEYCRMHDPGLVTPGWAHILFRVFPGPRREKEINAVYRIVRHLHYNNAYCM